MHYTSTNLGTNTVKLTTPSIYAIGTFGQYHLLVFRKCRVKFLNNVTLNGRLLDKMTTQVLDYSPNKPQVDRKDDRAKTFL